MGPISPYSILVTDNSRQGLAHHVYDLHIGRSAVGTPLAAVCGATIQPAPMVSPVGKPCQGCEERIAYLAWDGEPERHGIRQRLTHRIRRLVQRRVLKFAPKKRPSQCRPFIVTQSIR